jgi:hypothetical protein
MISIVGVLQQVCHHAAQKIHQDGRARNHEARREESAPGTSKIYVHVYVNVHVNVYVYVYVNVYA